MQDPKPYTLVFHPGVFVLNTRFKKAKTNLERYKLIKQYEPTKNIVHVYKYDDEKSAVSSAGDELFKNEKEYPIADVEQPESGVYIIWQEEAFLQIHAIWDDIKAFVGVTGFKAHGSKQGEDDFIKNHMHLFAPVNYYKDIYYGDGNTYLFTDGTKDESKKKAPYGIYMGPETTFVGGDLKEIIELVKTINNKKTATFSESLIDALRDAQDNITAYTDENNELSELLASMRAALVAMEMGKTKAFICHDNENVLWYLTGEYKRKEINTLTYLPKGEKYPHFNAIYRLFYKEVLATGIDIKFMHVYSHVGERETITIGNGAQIQSADKPIQLEDCTIFDNHIMFLGNRIADKLADGEKEFVQELIKRVKSKG